MSPHYVPYTVRPDYFWFCYGCGVIGLATILVIITRFLVWGLKQWLKKLRKG